MEGVLWESFDRTRVTQDKEVCEEGELWSFCSCGECYGYVKDYRIISKETEMDTIVNHFLPHIFDLFCIKSRKISLQPSYPAGLIQRRG